MYAPGSRYADTAIGSRLTSDCWPNRLFGKMIDRREGAYTREARDITREERCYGSFHSKLSI